MSYNEPPNYGTPPPPPGGGYGGPGQPYGGQPGFGNQPPGTSVLAIISLVTGIIGILCCPYFIFAIAATVLGFLGKKEIDQGKKSGKGMAIAGLALGITSIVIGVIFWVLVVATGSFDANYYSDF